MSAALKSWNFVLAVLGTVAIAAASAALQPAAVPPAPASPGSSAAQTPAQVPLAPIHGLSMQVERVVTTLPDGSKIVRMVPKGSARPSVVPETPRDRLQSQIDPLTGNPTVTDEPGAAAVAGEVRNGRMHPINRPNVNAGSRTVSQGVSVRSPRVAGWRPDRPLTAIAGTEAPAGGESSTSGDNGSSALGGGPAGGPSRLGDAWRAGREGEGFRGSAPDAPSGLTAEDALNGRDVRLSWTDNSTNATGSHIQRESLFGTTWGGVLDFSVGPTVTAFRDPAGPGTYRYRANAINPAGASAATDWAEVTVAGVAPAAPSNLAITGQTPRLTWTDNANNEAGFDIERETLSGTTWGNGAAFAVSQNTAAYVEWPGVGTFHYRVRAYNDVGGSAFTPWVQVTTVEFPPTGAPSTIAVVSLNDGVSSKATWKDNSTNEASFEIQRQKQSGTTWLTAVTLSASANSEELVDNPADGTFRYRLRAVNSAGASAYTAYAQVTIAATPPSAPTGLLASTLTSLTQVKLRWTDTSSNETNFELNREKLTGSTWGTAATITYGANVVQATDTPGVGTFRYRLRSKNAAGVSAWTGWVTPDPADVAPAAPSNLAVVDGGNALLATASWRDNSTNEAGFELDRETLVGTAWTNPQTFTVGVNAVTYADSPGVGTHHYRVRAVNASGDSANTAWAQVVVRDQPPAAPSDLYVADVGDGQQTFMTWTDNSTNEAGFEIVRETQSGTSWISPITLKTVANSGELIDSPGVGTFRYKVRAANTVTNLFSAYTPTATVTVLRGVPTAPSGVTASDLGTKKALVSWVDNSLNESGFQIKRTPSFLAGPTVNVDANVSGYVDQCGTGTFSYSVQSYNVNGGSGYVGPVSVTVVDSPPASPSGLVVLDVGNETQTKVSWVDNSDNEDSFLLERETQVGTSWGLKQSFTIAKNVMTFTDSPGGGTHRYRVTAVNAATGNSAATAWVIVTLSSGWTQFTASSDTRIVYVSSSSGNDANDGLSEAKAKKTLAGGKSLMRQKFPDWMLLKRGDVWDESFGQWLTSGRSALEPTMIGTYGTAAARPLVRTGIKDGIYFQGGGSAPASNEHFAIVGIHLWANGRVGTEQCAGMAFLRTGENILIEDCVFQGFLNNLNIQGGSADTSWIKNFRLRRSLLLDSYSGGASHSQGMFAEMIDGFVVEDCVIDHNGWSETVASAKATIFNHNFYLSRGVRNVMIRRNIISRASSHGVSLNQSGTIEDNLFVKNPIGMFIRTAPSTARGNVILESRDISTDLPRGFGIIVGKVYDTAPLLPPGPALVENNIIANKTSLGTNEAVSFTSNVAPKNTSTTIRNNIVYNWKGTSIDMAAVSTSVYDTCVISGNAMTELAAKTYLVVSTPSPFPTAQVRFSGNKYFSSYPANNWFLLRGTTNQTFAQWAAAVGETGSSAVESRYKAPSRNVGTYMATLGMPATFDAFIAEARKQSKANWRAEYRSEAVIAYIRDGFTPQ